MEFTKESECPDSYLYWAALFTLSSATQRHVYTWWAYYNVYPNLYVMLVGPAGNRKTSATRFTRDLLRDVKVPIASSSVSREALGDQMKSRGGDTQAISVVNNEFASFIATSGDTMVEFLTDIFDCDKNFEHGTRGSGVVKIEKPFLTMFTGAIPEWIANTFDATFIEGGFASRTIFINENKVRFRNARPQMTESMRRTRESLVRDLEQIMTLQGIYEWTPEADEWFDHWYEQVYPKQRFDRKLAGYRSRKPLHMIKVAMLLALDKGDELTITRHHFEEALKQIELIEPKMIEAFSAVGRNPFASNLERIEFEIRSRGEMTRGEIIKEVYHDIPNKQILDEILENLELMGKVTRKRIGDKNIYRPRRSSSERD